MAFAVGSYKTVGGSTATVTKTDTPGTHPLLGYTRISSDSQPIDEMWTTLGIAFSGKSEYNLIEATPATPIPLLVKNLDASPFSATITSTSKATFDTALKEASKSNVRLLTKAEVMYLYDTSSTFKSSISGKSCWVVESTSSVSSDNTYAWLFSGSSGSCTKSLKTGLYYIVTVLRGT